MKVYARVAIEVNGEKATFALQRTHKNDFNHRIAAKLGDKYCWVLEAGPEWMRTFTPDSVAELDEIPEWATKTSLVEAANA